MKVKCRECKAEISTSAKACPQCGAKKPAQGKIIWGLNQLAKLSFSLGIILILATCVFGIAGAQERGTLSNEEREELEAQFQKIRFDKKIKKMIFKEVEDHITLNDGHGSGLPDRKIIYDFMKEQCIDGIESGREESGQKKATAN